MESNYLALLGLARRAGMLEIGDESARVALQSKKARVLLMASDASDRTKDTFTFIAESCEVPYVEVSETREELGNALGKRPCAAVAVCDIGFASAIIKKLSEHNEAAALVAGEIISRAEKSAARRKASKQKK